MSNKIVPSIYRTVIDDVMSAIKPEFDEFGISEDVLSQLQSKWESKVIASHVADFEVQPPPVPQQPNYARQGYPQQPPPIQPQQHNSYIKAEPIDPRYAFAPQAFGQQSLPGPVLPGPRLPGQGVFPAQTYPPQQPLQQYRLAQPLQQLQQPPPGRLPQTDGPSGPGSMKTVIPQVDGPSEDDSDEDGNGGYAPHTAHPSLPQPIQTSAAAPKVFDAEAINSDLDDSDTGDEDDGDDGGGGDTDIVFCTYDKVARVKNKWKVTLKDGMIHINGRDYLFQKCTGEFEW